VHIRITRTDERSRAGIQKLRRSDDPELNAKQDEEQGEQGTEMTRGARPGRRLSGRKYDFAPETVYDRAGHERHDGEHDERVEHRGNRGEREEVESDVPATRIAPANKSRGTKREISTRTPPPRSTNSAGKPESSAVAIRTFPYTKPNAIAAPITKSAVFQRSEVRKTGSKCTSLNQR
jgi:hypothetical protein